MIGSGVIPRNPTLLEPSAEKMLAVAYHEAAHAVAAVLAGVFVNEVSLNPGGPRLGECRCALYDLCDARHREWQGGRPPRGVRRQIIQTLLILVAGPVVDALRFLSMEPARVKPSDFARILPVVFEVAPESDVGWFWDLADLLEPNSSRVARLVELIQTHALCLLLENWPAVESLALLLIANQRVPGGQVRLIVRRSSLRR